MKMKKLVIAIAGVFIASLIAGSAMAGPSSAKFAAAWSDDRFNVVSVADTDPATTEINKLDVNHGYTLATIKVPQDKELLVGLSAEIGLYTDTTVKGKEGGQAKAFAGAAGHVFIAAVPAAGYNGTFQVAKPGGIVLSARYQELSATLGGVLQACIDEGTLSVDSAGTCTETCSDNCAEPTQSQDITSGTCADVSLNSCLDGEVTIPCECSFTDEEIGLLQATLAAHHFNFVIPDMDQGVYKIVAFFTTAAVADVEICDGAGCGEGTAEASAVAKAAIGKYMLTVQQVRAVNDPDALQEVEITEL